MSAYANKTLGTILEDIDSINNTVLIGGAFIDVKDLDREIIAAHELIKYLQSVCKRVADVSNNISRLRKFRCAQYGQTTIAVEPSDGAVSQLRLLKEPSMPMTIVQCMPHISVPVIRVKCRAEISPSPLYYVENEKQFAVDIAGCLVAGDIGNIYARGGDRTAACFARQHCAAVRDGRVCEFWHDPRDYLAVGHSVPDDHHRNFTVGSFVYSSAVEKRGKSARHVGDRHRLLLDMYRLATRDYNDEIWCRESQLMHDILTFVVMYKVGFYAGCPKISNATFLSQYGIIIS